MAESVVGLLGATSLVGEQLINRLVAGGHEVCAYSRKSAASSADGVIWRQLSAPGSTTGSPIKDWLCVAPIWTLPEHAPLLEISGARRVVGLSSTSRFTKTNSSDATENAIAARLIEGEARLEAWAGSKGIEWVILRPTLIYGLGRDKNIAEIARFIRRVGFFPLLGKAKGLRQPVHAEDVASACLAALRAPGAANRTYNLSGGEALPYREMVARVFTALGCPPRLLPVPLPAFRVAVSLLRYLPRYRHWSSAMAERMNRDQVFDHSDATRDLAFEPRAFVLSPADVAT